jgi:hypothetical protein
VHARSLALALAALALSCGDSEFKTRYASDYVQGAHTSVSVFGVYKDGRLNAEAWNQYGPELATPLGGSACDVAYSEALLRNDSELSNVVDTYVRENGVTDEFIDLFAPSAKGDAILVVRVSGRPAPSNAGAGRRVKGPQPQSSPPPGSAKMRGPAGSGTGQAYAPGEDRMGMTRPAFEISATLFSVRLHHSVAQFEMKYTGADPDDAVKRFAAKLASSMPGLACTGWNTEARVDPEAIKHLAAQ